jgi:hypothetical protein
MVSHFQDHSVQKRARTNPQALFFMKEAVTVVKHLYVLLQFCKLKGNIVLTFLAPITVVKNWYIKHKLIMHNDFPKQKHLEE